MATSIKKRSQLRYNAPLDDPPRWGYRYTADPDATLNLLGLIGPTAVGRVSALPKFITPISALITYTSNTDLNGGRHFHQHYVYSAPLMTCRLRSLQLRYYTKLVPDTTTRVYLPPKLIYLIMQRRKSTLLQAKLCGAHHCWQDG